MKLKKIKEFVAENITDDIAAELCAIGLMWDHYREPKYKDPGFTIERHEPIGILKSGSGSIHPWNGDDSHYYKEIYTGVTITPKSNPNNSLHISGNGRSQSFYYSEERKRTENNHSCDQILWVQKLIDLGFYTII